MGSSAGNRLVCRQRQICLGSLWLVCIVTGIVGCGAKVVPIEGTVSLDGNPLPDVQVLLDQPDNPSSNSFSGKTNDSGHFVLQSVHEELRDPVAGTYRVSLTTAVLGRDALENTPTPKERIPKQYRNGKLTFDLPEDGTANADFDLESK